ncbi:MAG: hypothetical protein HC866_26320 [Leptolyngbyaceae cyanobacterium RU_5_1]|nr:hypothetical protein [Leptolyngbyaceae cyanobacterium RU_5_1]
MPKFSVSKVLEIIKNLTLEEKLELQRSLPDVLSVAATAVSQAVPSPAQKERVRGDITLIEKSLQKQNIDKSFVDEAIVALKQALSAVITLAEPVTKVAELLAKAWNFTVQQV